MVYNMEKILMVTGSLRVGGLERVALSCAQYSDRSKYVFDFLVFGDEIGGYETEAQELGGKVIRIPKPSNGYIHFYNNVCKVINEFGPYIAVHSNTFFNSGLVLMSAAHCGIEKRIAHSHSIKRKGSTKPSKWLYNQIMRLLIKHYATDWCACSNAAGKYMFGSSFVSKGIIVPNIVDCSKFEFRNSDRIAIRKELGISNEKKVIGFVGHLTSVKNPLFFLKIAETFKSRDEYMFVAVGDGPCRNQLEDYIQKYSLQNKVFITGIRSDVPKLLSAFDLLVCTSWNEGLGIVLLEAQANGLTTIAEKNAIVEEVQQLGACKLVDGFEKSDDWATFVDCNIDNGHSEFLANRLRQSIYTEAGLSDVLNKLYTNERTK